MHVGDVAAARGPLAIPGLVVRELVAPPDLEVPFHRHEAAYFRTVIHGSLRNEASAKAAGGAREPRTVFHPAGTSHASWIGPTGARSLRVEPSDAWLARVGCDAALPSRPVALARRHLAPARRIASELRYPDAASELIVEGLVLELLGAAIRESHAECVEQRSLARAIDVLHAELAQPLSLVSVARQVGMEPLRLSQAFRRRYGQTLGEYQRRLRVELVRRELAGPRPLAEIAYDAGFCDQAHCTRVFKAIVGTTPGAYRNALDDRDRHDAMR